MSICFYFSYFHSAAASNKITKNKKKSKASDRLRATITRAISVVAARTLNTAIKRAPLAALLSRPWQRLCHPTECPASQTTLRVLTAFLIKTIVTLEHPHPLAPQPGQGDCATHCCLLLLCLAIVERKSKITMLWKSRAMWHRMGSHPALSYSKELGATAASVSASCPSIVCVERRGLCACQYTSAFGEPFAMCITVHTPSAPAAGRSSCAMQPAGSAPHVKRETLDNKHGTLTSTSPTHRPTSNSGDERQFSSRLRCSRCRARGCLSSLTAMSQ